ncbi:ATPase [Serpentinicella alkaliphila]|uniref:AAA domain-containing protein n=1 Tax=Serpentinicella alkaliphila TaxID=1734049 RepID=A0A4R2SSW1_9FIRM|nr:ATPase [Serpentinicella alkaliphila]QUH26137.1 ATPase [Serpentinicella alkaliphila]TCP93447.1 hypothetical protein EDD79_10772 [Serpentinicella alkaliphila]
MNPVYLDLHIHTSENPNSLNQAYDIDCLLSKIEENSLGSDILISLTDHNTINKKAYLALLDKCSNVLLGVELHIRNYDSEPAYHCHIYFNINPITEIHIDDINEKLNDLYPDKVIRRETQNVPKLDDVIRKFDIYDFILLPHGGQSHSTFDKSIPDGVTFDTTLERSIYYNQFDGFTARSNGGLENTVRYFKRLGINEFVNLITCTDNYNPKEYPNAKASDASPFVPTWMLALPTFNGLRLSLSESSRLIYSETKPSDWAEYIKKVNIKNDLLDIDVDLTPGLNVVIGGSSSGKTLFVDSLYRKISNDFAECDYTKFGVEDINILNPSGSRPHYINQNYIIKVIDKSNESNGIDDIEIIRSVFPGDENVTAKARTGLANLKRDLNTLINCVKTIEIQENKLSRIPAFSRLITKADLKENLASKILPDDEVARNSTYNEEDYLDHKKQLDLIGNFLSSNPFAEEASEEIQSIKDKLERAFELSKFEKEMRCLIQECKNDIDMFLSAESMEQQSKIQNIERMLSSIKEYAEAMKCFEDTMNSIANYSIICETQRVMSMGHVLYIENDFVLSKDKVVEVINRYLKTEYRINNFHSLHPRRLYERGFSKRNPKVNDYEEFESKIYSEFEKMNKKTYRIVTSEGKNFDDLSAGWKTSVLLDIILGYEGDNAPLIIDQPEDNLATNYINHGLIAAIKNIKSKKQVILVSHNATIPMLGDAQNVILCRNTDKICIRSSQLEGTIDNKYIVDYIAEITDGGKSSIKKRVKKYNLKKFRE